MKIELKLSFGIGRSWLILSVMKMWFVWKYFCRSVISHETRDSWAQTTEILINVRWGYLYLLKHYSFTTLCMSFHPISHIVTRTKHVTFRCCSLTLQARFRRDIGHFKIQLFSYFIFNILLSLYNNSYLMIVVYHNVGVICQARKELQTSSKPTLCD